MSEGLTSLTKRKIFPDAYYLYELTGSGAGAGDDIKEYIAYDLGIFYGYKTPQLVYTLSAATAEDTGTWTNRTEAAISLSGSTFTAIPVTDVQYDALYIGYPNKFTGCRINMGVAGVDGGTLVATWEYPNTVNDRNEPTAWYDLNEEDNTASAAGKGLDVGTSTYSVEFEVPTDWVKCNLDGDNSTLSNSINNLYWIKFMVGTAGYTTAPTIESVQVVEPLPATALTVLDSIDDPADLYLNTTNTAGTESEKTNIPIPYYQQTEVEGMYIHNFTLKNLANTKIAKVWVEAHAGEWS